MTQSETLAYLAGIVDGEAYIGIKRTTNPGRVTMGYHARIQVRMVIEDAIQLLAGEFGGKYYHEKSHSALGRPLFCWQISDALAASALKQLLPYLRVKRLSANKVLEFRSLQSESRKHQTKVVGSRIFTNQYGAKRTIATKTLSDEYIAMCERLYLDAKRLNRVGV